MLENIVIKNAKENNLKNVSLTIPKNKLIVFSGVSGCGKSTLMQILSGAMHPDTGVVDQGETVRVGYLSQETQIDDLSVRVIDYLQSDRIETKDESLSASQMLERFLFPKNLHYLTLAHISGGERRRLGLLKVLMDQPNILFLDEPTNDLDIDTLNVLEEFLDEFKGALIVVSHDRYFLDKVCDHVLIFQNGSIMESLGSFSANAEKIEPETIKKEKPVVISKPKSKGLTYMEKKELADLDKKMPALEQKIHESEHQLNECSDYGKMKILSDQLEQDRELLEEMTLRWLELSEKAEG